MNGSGSEFKEGAREVSTAKAPDKPLARSMSNQRLEDLAYDQRDVAEESVSDEAFRVSFH